MKTITKFLFFIVIYNLIFIFILNTQYIIRFDKPTDLSSMLFYSSIPSIASSIIPLGCFILSWFILKAILTKKEQNLFLKSTLLFLFTVISTYILIEIIVGDPIFNIITISAVSLTLVLFFFTYRKKGFFNSSETSANI